MLQSSLKPGLLFQRCNSAYVTRLPVIWRTVWSAERQYVPRTSTSTPSTSKIRICVGACFLAAGTEILEQKQGSGATWCQEQLTKETGAVKHRPSFIDQVSAEQSAGCTRAVCQG